MTITRLQLIRHGETEANKRGILVGSSDVPLNDTGRSQCALLAGRMRQEPPDLIFSSPLQRAVETALLVFGKDARIVTDSRLREFHFGQWEDLAFKEIAARYPELWHNWVHKRQDTPIPGAEDFTDFARRLSTFCTDTIARHPGQTLAVVSHGGCIRALLGHYFSGSAEAGYWRFKVENATLTEVEFADEFAILTRFNHC